MKKQIKKAAILGIIAIVGFTLWRNYGVLPKGAVILDSALGSDKENTKEK